MAEGGGPGLDERGRGGESVIDAGMAVGVAGEVEPDACEPGGIPGDVAELFCDISAAAACCC